ncbi:DUF5817 domain-containing protein [Halococcus saccharolyticus]|uniref:Uncharacterized protein n=1 Tax=Halococcus saccharolyticus DSM 5350 TaxID=1227455 RepID=M0MDA1_9EURY|nr:DUF5817 domain-containing protein [Halococcus saccharolyticus]EMA43328.1 hypothetical protein C449_15157 [Halococcus saccharolyticus DSM 5350]
MYAVVGCGECSALWVVESRPETTTCPSCGARHRYERLTKFAETDAADAAREARTALLADRSDHAPDDLDSFTTLETRAESERMDETAYLRESGVDAEAVTEAGEGATSGTNAGSASRLDTVRNAVDELKRPTEEDVIAYATARDVSAEFAERTLDRLVRQGEASRNDGVYRLL